MINANIRNTCYCEHENVNQSCLHCRFKVTKEKVSLSNGNYLEDKKKINKVNETLISQRYDDEIRYDIRNETKKYLERIFSNHNCVKNNIVTNKNVINNEYKNINLMFQLFFEILKVVLNKEIFDDVLKVYDEMYFYIQVINIINKNVYVNEELFKKNQNKEGKVIFLNDKISKYIFNANERYRILNNNQCDSLFYSSIQDYLFSLQKSPIHVKWYEGIKNDSFIDTKYNSQNIYPKISFERLIIINDSLFINETLCSHTKIKKFIIGGYQNTSFNDKNILIFGIKNSNKSMFINHIFYFLYKWIKKEDINFFINKIDTLNRDTELCIYEFNNTSLPYKISLIDCPEYNVNHDYRKQFTSKKLYKNFLRKYVTSKGYFVLSSVVIAMENENDLKNDSFEFQIKKLKHLFGKSNDYCIFEECLNGKLKFNGNKKNFTIFNNISQYLKKLENNYKVLLKLP